ncbi:uncharacterized protein [Magallana gigas]|uniref:uncharacterized protein n=1 Tax=Magallana gigas TaxID=29159 RepID=UPI0033407638
MDGTFYSSPGQFYQLYSIYGEINGRTYPLVFGLLPGKSEGIYQRFFRLLMNYCGEINVVFQPQIVMCDFEVAVRNVLQRVFPEATVKGCFFHFTQCIWKKTQSLGLATMYRNNDGVQKLVRRAASLPLVPINPVGDVWFNTLEDTEEVNVDITRFADYVTEQWIEGTDVQFWNHFDNTGPRTNNILEGWHSKINKQLNAAHPNIYRLISLLQCIQANNEADIIQTSAGAKQRPQEVRYRRIDQRLTQLKNRFIDGDIGIMEYLDAASYLLHLG